MSASLSKKNQDVCMMVFYFILAVIFLHMLMNVVNGKSCFDFGLLKNEGTLATPTTTPAATGTPTPAAPRNTTAPKSTGTPRRNRPPMRRTATPSSTTPPTSSNTTNTQRPPNRAPTSSGSSTKPMTTTKPTQKSIQPSQPVSSQRIMQSEGIGQMPGSFGSLELTGDPFDDVLFESQPAPLGGQASSMSNRGAMQQPDHNKNLQTNPVADNGARINGDFTQTGGAGDVQRAMNGTKATPTPGSVRRPGSTRPPGATAAPTSAPRNIPTQRRTNQVGQQGYEGSNLASV